jgi:D-serine deaminase-like pyridoxal phosphate-dependent protein
MTEQKWYTIDNIDQLDTPALVVYPHRVKQNIDMIKFMIDDVFRLRPHVKTHKSKEVTMLMIDAGIIKFKCAAIAEAEMLGMCTAPDVLLAYQPFGPKLERLMHLVSNYPATKFSCLVDNLLSAVSVSAAAVKKGIKLNVYIDLNIGMNRTGILPGEDALQLYKNCIQLSGIIPVGLHAYDGQIHDTELATRIKKSNKTYAPVAKMQAKLIKLGYPHPVIIAGGSPTFSINASRKNIECSAGTFVYWDKNYQHAFAEEPFLTAALVIARVISLPTKTTICIDCGHKSVASESELSKRIYFLNAPELKMISHSEEHLVADAGAGHPFKIGDVLYGLPYHICPTVALYERAVTVEYNNITGEWMNIARDRKIKI